MRAVRKIVAAGVLALLGSVVVACGGSEGEFPISRSTSTPNSEAPTATEADPTKPADTPTVEAVCSFEDAAERAVSAAVLVITPDGFGTAFYMGDGEFVTAEHVVTGLAEVRLESELVDVQARVVAVDAETDVALIEADPADLEGLAILSWFEGPRIRPGQAVGTAGYPVDVTGAAAVTRGIVSKVVASSDGNTLVQTDAPVNPGNSGGALFDQCGSVLGVVIQKWTSIDIEGVALATAFDTAQRSLASAAPPVVRPGGGVTGPGGGTTSENTFVIGEDLAPGTYQNTDSSDVCYWERLSGFREDGASGIGYVSEDIIDSRSSGEIVIVEIQPSDAGFYSLDCGSWQLLDLGPPSGPSYPDGTYEVGADMQPGYYRNTDSADVCYWERLSGFREDDDSGFGYVADDVIESALSDQIQIVEVRASDAGFYSLDCDSWQLILEGGGERPPRVGDNVSVFDLRMGDCFLESGDAVSANMNDVLRVDCDDLHDAEVYFLFDVGDADDSYPGRDAVTEISLDGCVDRFEPFVGTAYADSRLYVGALFPSAQSWPEGDRTAICYVYDFFGDALVGSAEGSGE